MEEYGKALFLRDFYNKIEDEKLNFIEFNKYILFGGNSHDSKFERAKKELVEIPEIIGVGVKVSTNTAETNVEVKTSDGQIFHLPALSTGSFFDTSNYSGKQNRVDLRFSDFYVGWDFERDSWISPDPILLFEPAKVVEVLSSVDIEKCINILKNRINEELAKFLIY